MTHRLKKFISGFLKKEEVELLEKVSERTPSKYNKVYTEEKICPNCDFHMMYKSIRCPECNCTL